MEQDLDYQYGMNHYMY